MTVGNKMSEDDTSPLRDYQLIGPADDGTISNLLNGKTNKESRQRLQALITEWLRMENLVVLTGAGTSVSLGGKTMDCLESTVLGTLKVLPEAPVSMKEVINARLTSAASDEKSTRLGFENWLSYLVNGYFISSTPNSPFDGVKWKDNIDPPKREDLSWFVKWVQAAIFAECALILQESEMTTKRPDGVAPHMAFLAKLVARDSSLGRAHLFTLNYDTLFEQACERLGIQ